jgi:hypothetical protein
MGILDLMNNVTAGYDQGREIGRQSTLAKLYAQSLSAAPESRTGLLGKIAGVGGIDAATGAQKAINGIDETARADLGRSAMAFLALPDDQKEAAYPSLLAQAQAVRLPVPTGPYNKAYDAGIQQFAQAFGGAGATSEVQTFNALTQGFTPEERQKALRVHAGLAPRAVTAAMKFDTFTGSDGRPRPQRNNPTTGGVEIFYDELGQWVPLGAQNGASTPNATAPGVNVAIDGVPADEQARIAKTASFMRQAGYSDADIDAFVTSRLPQAQQTPTIPGLGVGRTKEEEAGKVKAAELQAQVDAAPMLGKLDAENEATKARAVADVQRDTVAGIEGNKQLGTDAAKTFQTIRESGQAGMKERARLLVLRDNLGKTYTGPGANSLLTLKKVANAFGVKVDGLGEGEAARAIANQLALSLRNPAGGEGMPGAMSDADREFLRQSTPGLQNSPQGWKALVDIRIGLANAAVEQAQYAEQLRRKGVPVTDIPGMVQEYANQHPIFQVHDSVGRRKSLLEKY